MWSNNEQKRKNGLELQLKESRAANQDRSWTPIGYRGKARMHKYLGSSSVEYPECKYPTGTALRFMPGAKEQGFIELQSGGKVI